jgi:hypothetical protein
MGFLSFEREEPYGFGADFVASQQRDLAVIMVNGQLQRIVDNPLLRERHSRVRASIKAHFPQVASCPHIHFLAIVKYLDRSPERFYSHTAFATFFEWLEARDLTHRAELRQYLMALGSELDRALLHLLETNRLDWHDHFESLDDYELIQFIDRYVHPAYLRLVEAVYSPLLLIVAYFSRIDRGAGTDGLDVWSISQVLVYRPRGN